MTKQRDPGKATPFAFTPIDKDIEQAMLEVGLESLLEGGQPKDIDESPYPHPPARGGGVEVGFPCPSLTCGGTLDRDLQGAGFKCGGCNSKVKDLNDWLKKVHDFDGMKSGFQAFVAQFGIDSW